VRTNRSRESRVNAPANYLCDDTGRRRWWDLAVSRSRQARPPIDDEGNDFGHLGEDEAQIPLHETPTAPHGGGVFPVPLQHDVPTYRPGISSATMLRPTPRGPFPFTPPTPRSATQSARAITEGGPHDPRSHGTEWGHRHAVCTTAWARQTATARSRHANCFPAAPSSPDIPGSR
jgi:hypothetical protein